MKKVSLIVMIFGASNAFALTPAQQAQARVKNLLSTLERDRTQAKTICPKLCNNFAANTAPDVACSLCYQTCSGKAKRKDLRAQRMMSTCGKKGYPGKCCREIGSKCVSKDALIDKLQEDNRWLKQDVANLKVDQQTRIVMLKQAMSMYLKTGKQIDEQKIILDVVQKYAGKPTSECRSIFKMPYLDPAAYWGLKKVYDELGHLDDRIDAGYKYKPQDNSILSKAQEALFKMPLQEQKVTSGCGRILRYTFHRGEEKIKNIRTVLKEVNKVAKVGEVVSGEVIQTLKAIIGAIERIFDKVQLLIDAKLLPKKYSAYISRERRPTEYVVSQQTRNEFPMVGTIMYHPTPGEAATPIRALEQLT